MRLAELSSDKWFHSPLSNRNWGGEKKQWYVLLVEISKLSHLKKLGDYKIRLINRLINRKINRLQKEKLTSIDLESLEMF